jgi:pimeloyl-ACP methyl ester carboxylesterase
MLESLGVSVPRPFAPQIRSNDTAVGGVSGRLYLPEEPGAPAVLIVPGATPAGLNDTRVETLAHAIARSSRTVFVPDLDLYQERFSEQDLERIVGAIEGLAERTSTPVSVLGTSYGGSFALIAAADPRTDGRIARVATLGAYYDLIGVIQAVTTGSSVVGDELIVWQPHPLARNVLFARAAELVPEPERSRLIDALGGNGSRQSLSPPARALFDLLINTDPYRTYDLAARLPPEVTRFLERFSPKSIAGSITFPVAVMHSTDDPLVPYGELQRMEDGLQAERMDTVALFSHVDFNAASPRDWIEVTPDLWKVWGFTTWLLAER